MMADMLRKFYFQINIKIFSKVKLRNEDKFFELQKKTKFYYAYYSYLENWDPYKNYLFAKKNLVWKKIQTPTLLY